MVHDMVISADYFYLIEEQDGKDVGLWHFHEWKDGVALHVAMTEACRGRRALESGKAALRWIFDNTDFRKVYAATEVRAAQFMAVWIGMKFLYVEQGHRVYMVEV